MQTARTYFTTADSVFLDLLADRPAPITLTTPERQTLQRLALLIGEAVLKQQHVEEERLPTRADIDENITAFET